MLSAAITSGRMQNFEITVIFVFIAFVRLKDAGTSQLLANRKPPARWTRMNFGLLIFSWPYVLSGLMVAPSRPGML
jgi:hypothetical protein